MNMNKGFFLAVNTGYFYDGIPTQECLNFYKARSGHGIYCAIVGNTVIKNGYSTNRSVSYYAN